MFLQEWSDKDRELALGLTMHENSITATGIPAHVAYAPESDGWLEARPFVDYGQAAADQWHKDNPEPDPGTFLRIVDARLEPDDED